MTNKALPKTPSKLLRVALEDLYEATDSGLHVDMKYWIKKNPLTKKLCSVCLAGASLIKRKNDIIDSICSDEQSVSFESKNGNKYIALNDFRMGHIQEGLFDLKIKNDLLDIDVPYTVRECENFQEFSNYIESLIGIFEAEGI